MKRGALEISFGMIVSILLIVVFIALTVYVVTKFIGVGETAQIGKFVATLQEDVDKVWQSDEASVEKEYSLPLEIEAICFVDEGKSKNLEFQSKSFISPRNIEHIDLSKTIDTGSSKCIQSENGKINVIIEKNYGDSLVTIKEQE